MRVLMTREQKLLCLFERSNGRFARDGRKPLQKVFECFPAFQVVKQRLDRHSRSAKHRCSPENIAIFDDSFHSVTVPRAWHRSLRRSNAVRSCWPENQLTLRRARGAPRKWSGLQFLDHHVERGTLDRRDIYGSGIHGHAHLPEGVAGAVREAQGELELAHQAHDLRRSE